MDAHDPRHLERARPDLATTGVAGVPSARVSTTPNPGPGDAPRRHRPVRRRPSPPAGGRPGGREPDHQLRGGPPPRPGRGPRYRLGTGGPRLPDPMAPALFAEVRRSPALPPRGAAADLRRPPRPGTDRRRFTSWPVPDVRLEVLAAAAREQRDRPAVALTDVTDRFRVELLVEPRPAAAGTRPSVRRRAAPVAQSAAQRRRTCHLRARPRRRPLRASAAASASAPWKTTGGDVEGSDGLVVLCAEDDSPEPGCAPARV